MKNVLSNKMINLFCFHFSLWTQRRTSLNANRSFNFVFRVNARTQRQLNLVEKCNYVDVIHKSIRRSSKKPRENCTTNTVNIEIENFIISAFVDAILRRRETMRPTNAHLRTTQNEIVFMLWQKLVSFDVFLLIAIIEMAFFRLGVSAKTFA